MKWIKSLSAFALALTLAACSGGGGDAGNTGSGTPTTAGTTPVEVASPSSAVSVAIGSGDTIETTAKEIKYAYRYAVTVSDANGKPVVGAKVTMRVVPTGFFKGRWVDGADDKRVQQVAAFCPTEDLNENEILDAGEDTNGDGDITPQKAEVVAVIEGTDITDNQGIVFVRIEWNKSHASWLTYRLTASASVQGSEGSRIYDTGAGWVAGDESKDTSAFVFSPYGVSSSCSDTQ
jgi:hypothetical protein